MWHPGNFFFEFKLWKEVYNNLCPFCFIIIVSITGIQYSSCESYLSFSWVADTIEYVEDKPKLISSVNRPLLISCRLSPAFLSTLEYNMYDGSGSILYHSRQAELSDTGFPWG
jgi:hypothetical protein